MLVLHSHFVFSTVKYSRFSMHIQYRIADYETMLLVLGNGLISSYQLG
jgi:hypothetical protein